MTLTYDFDGNSFEYELSRSEIDEYLQTQQDEVIAQAAEDAFSKMNEQQRSEVITEILNSGDIQLLSKHQEGTNVRYSVNWLKAVQDDRSWVLQFVDEEYFIDDDMYDYFYRKASEAYDDADAERKDPYGYRGLSPRDFY